jgi:hypothetical protein
VNLIAALVIDRFEAAGVPREQICFARESYRLEYPGSSSGFVNEFRTFYGPTMNAFHAAAKNGRTSELLGDPEELFAEQNSAPDSGSTSIPATFLRVTVQL